MFALLAYDPKAADIHAEEVHERSPVRAGSGGGHRVKPPFSVV
jgi:hypothetical protein